MSLSIDAVSLHIRDADIDDLVAIREIYNQGIDDRIATLDEDPKTQESIGEWYAAHTDRYRVLVAERNGRVVGWASLNPYSHRCAYRGVADLSIYIERASRGTGVGSVLLAALESSAGKEGFHKLVLFAFPFNDAGLRLYRKLGFRAVGTFQEQGQLDGRFVDVVAMEKIMKPFVLISPDEVRAAED